MISTTTIRGPNEQAFTILEQVIVDDATKAGAETKAKIIRA